LTKSLDKLFAEHKRVAEEAAKAEIRRSSYL
jgi:hypothetical protein